MSEYLERLCRHCGQKRSRHVGRAFACFGGTGTVWDPWDPQTPVASASEKISERGQAREQLQAWGYLNLSAMFRGMAGPVSDWIRVLPELAALTTRLAEKEAALQARDTQLSAELERADELRERIGREMDRAVAAETRLAEEQAAREAEKLSRKDAEADTERLRGRNQELLTRLAEAERESDEARTWAAALKEQAAVVGDTIPRLTKSLESAEQLLSEMAEGLREAVRGDTDRMKWSAILAKYDSRNAEAR